MTTWLTAAGARLTGLEPGDIAAGFVPTRAAQLLLILLASAGAGAGHRARRARRDWLIPAIPFIRKNSAMSTASPENTVLRVSSAGKEPVILSVVGGETVNIRIEVESNCTCQSEPALRAGAYTDSDLGLA